MPSTHARLSHSAARRGDRQRERIMGKGKARRAAIYLRVSTDTQTTDNQRRELEAIAERRGWPVVKVYEDRAISGAKSRNGRPALDQMMKDASRREFDVVMSWAVDRLGRSLVDLLSIIQDLEATGVDLYLEQQNVDTTTIRALAVPHHGRIR